MDFTEKNLADIRGVVVDVVMEALNTVVLPRFDALEARMDRLESRMDHLENRMDHLESSMDKLEGRVGSLEVAQRETTQQLRILNNTVNNVDGRLEALENDVKELYKMVGTLQLPVSLGKGYTAKSPEQKLYTLHTAVLQLADHMNVKL